MNVTNANAYDASRGRDGMVTRTATGSCCGYLFRTAQLILSGADNYRGIDHEIPCEVRMLLRRVRVCAKVVQMHMNVSS